MEVFDQPAVAPEREPAPAPTHIVLLDDWADLIAGRVLAADPDRMAELTRSGVRHRPATDLERAIAGAA